MVVFFDGEAYWLADGFHRVLAHERAGLVDVLAEVRAGSKRDALLFAVGANDNHGLRRNGDDKRRAVEILLRDEEWGAKSENWIAERARVDHKTVARIRADLGIPKSAERTGKDGRTINTANIGKGKAKPADPTPTPPAEPDHPAVAAIASAPTRDALDAAYTAANGAGLSGHDGQVLDGRNRLAACELAGVESCLDGSTSGHLGGARPAALTRRPSRRRATLALCAPPS